MAIALSGGAEDSAVSPPIPFSSMSSASAHPGLVTEVKDIQRLMKLDRNINLMVSTSLYITIAASCCLPV